MTSSLRSAEQRIDAIRTRPLSADHEFLLLIEPQRGASPLPSVITRLT